MKPLLLALALAGAALLINYALVAIDGAKPTPHQQELKTRGEYYRNHSTMKGYDYN